MTIHPARLIASVLLAVGGFLVAVTALGIAIAKILVDAGLAIRPPDAALLADVTALLPFVVAFAGANILAAVGLLIGRTWADRLAIGAATVAVTIGAFGLFLIVAGSDPFATTTSARSVADGIGIVGAFTLLYLAVIGAVILGRPSHGAPAGAGA